MTGCMSFPMFSESHRPGACNVDTNVHVYTDWYKLFLSGEKLKVVLLKIVSFCIICHFFPKCRPYSSFK